ncbi:MAG: succinate--CoA ligase subunit beta, partial [Rhodothermaceae bacterium]|nr:succinate--CoA ligase subunit beta [Rhodothermaceae bacterium]
MKVHEYQAKNILEEYGVAMQPGEVASTVAEAVEVARGMLPVHGELFVVKAQIHAGVRGKGGGVKL